MVIFLPPFLVIYALLGFISGNLKLFSEDGLEIISGISWKIAAVLALFWFVFLQKVFPRSGSLDSKTQGVDPPLGRLFWASTIGFILLLVTDFPTRRFLFYPNAGIRTEIIFIGLLALLLLYSRRKQVRLEIFSPLFLLFCQVMLTIIFLQYANGRLLFSDDHPSFLYRLELLRKHFPDLPFYNIDWNAGYSAREFFATGALNIFFVTWPLLYLLPDLTSFEGAKFYTYLIPYIFIFLVPWSVYWASRLFGFGKKEALLGAFFALGPSLGYFEWVLKFGTIGFAFSAGLVPLTLALAYRLVNDQHQPCWKEVFLLLVVSSCCLAWTLSFLAFVPIVFFALLKFQTTFSHKRFPKIAAFTILFLVCNGPWMLTFVRESRVLEFLSNNSLPGSRPKGTPQHAMLAAEENLVGSANLSLQSPLSEPHKTNKPFGKRLSRTHKKFKEAFSNINPLLLLFFLPGLALVADKKARGLLAATLAWLLLVAVIGDNAKPQLELRRMVVPASFFMAILAGGGMIIFLKYLNDTRERIDGTSLLQRFGYGLTFVFILGGIFVSPLAIGSIFLNRSDDKYVFATPAVERLSQAIKEFGGEGRTFFLGFILHELSSTVEGAQNGGHIAPLASFTGKDLYAVGYYHSHWNSLDPVPRMYLKRGREGIEEFLNLVNATAVVTFRPEWTEYCTTATNYHQVFQDGQFHLFVRDAEKLGYFLKGTGAIMRTENGFVVIPQSEESVLKFRYLPRLKASFSSLEEGSFFPVRVFEEEIGDGKVAEVNFIGLRVSKKFIEEKKAVSIGY